VIGGIAESARRYPSNANFILFSVGWPTSRNGITGKLLFKRHRFPPDIICYGVWLYFRFTSSFRWPRAALAQPYDFAAELIDVTASDSGKMASMRSDW
jgi:hypothetical protein